MFNSTKWERTEGVKKEIRLHGPGNVFKNRINRSARFKKAGNLEGAQLAENEARKVLALATN